jgi:hypothetical protein
LFLQEQIKGIIIVRRTRRALAVIEREARRERAVVRGPRRHERVLARARALDSEAAGYVAPAKHGSHAFMLRWSEYVPIAHANAAPRLIMSKTM